MSEHALKVVSMTAGEQAARKASGKLRGWRATALDVVAHRHAQLDMGQEIVRGCRDFNKDKPLATISTIKTSSRFGSATKAHRKVFDTVSYIGR